MSRIFSRRTRLMAVAVVGVYVATCRVIETRRLNQRLPGASQDASATERLDTARTLDDLRVLASDEFQGRATGTAGGHKAGDYIQERFRTLGLSNVPQMVETDYIQPFSFSQRSVRALWRRDRPFSMTFSGARNVLGWVTGLTLNDDVIVVSAHYDHLGIRSGAIYHGADDNASGTAALLAMAAYFSAHPPRHSMVFAAFDGEELGLRGSGTFVDALSRVPWRALVDVNMDMISRSDGGGRLFVAGTYQRPAFRADVERAALTTTMPVHLGHDRPIYLSGLIDDWTSASDQGSFNDRGIPFLYFGVEDHPDVHQPTDSSERIDQNFFRRAAEVVLETVLSLDMRLGTSAEPRK